MKKMVVVAIVMFLIADVVYAKSYEVQKKVGEYDVRVLIDKNPPITGDNEVSITIRDAAGKTMNDVLVKVEYSMPAMTGMTAMNYKTDAVLQDDKYKAIMGLSMSGSWNIAVKITKSGKTSTMKFTVDAR